MLAALLFSSAVAITIDDVPGTAFPPRERCNAAAVRAWNAKLIAGLQKHRAPAIGFVNSAKCVSSALDLWLRAGEQLGNHTAHHVDLNSLTPSEFERDVIAGEGPLPERRWFRYPMLHTGATREVRDEVHAWLAKRGYRSAVVTLDSNEFLFNDPYAAALGKGDTAHAKRIADAYVRFIESIVVFYEKRTREVIGRDIPQILLVHDSALLADHIDDVLTMLERRGYRFVTIDEAMRDPAYALPDGYAGPRGLSWIHRWGLAKGMPVVLEPDPGIPR